MPILHRPPGGSCLPLHPASGFRVLPAGEVDRRVVLRRDSSVHARRCDEAGDTLDCWALAAQGKWKDGSGHGLAAQMSVLGQEASSA
jgi:hypothetical protein